VLKFNFEIKRKRKSRSKIFSAIEHMLGLGSGGVVGGVVGGVCVCTQWGRNKQGGTAKSRHTWRMIDGYANDIFGVKASRSLIIFIEQLWYE